MARVMVELPSILVPIMGGKSQLPVDAATLREVFARIPTDYPQLGVHLFQENGELREHVLCFHNGTNTRWLDSLDIPLTDGDQLVVMQAVSGG